jgi:hypothetical protein
MIGHELVVDAITSWQPALCTGGGALYSYTQLGDDVIRNQILAGSSPGLALVTNPIPPDAVPAGEPQVYAPIGLSGLAIAFNIEHQPPPPDDPNAPPSPDQELDGQRFTSMNLTPRLVAKLLTQSYRHAVLAPPDAMKNNPTGLTVDPDFLALNPPYQGFVSVVTAPPDALVQLGGADITSLLWSWVKADPDAVAFIAGTPDKFGMVVNPSNQGLILPASTFPRNDQSCIDANFPQQGATNLKYCTLDAHPFTLDMHDAGRSAGRGDSQARNLEIASNGAPTPTKIPRQAPGQRSLLAVVDAATATRYGLPTAALRNAAGQFVTPTTTSLQAGVAAMKPSAVPSVLASDPVATDPAAYPLTALSYAVASPPALDAAAGKDYAAFLRYAAGPGQQPGIAPGQLPLGMAPLPDALRAQTITAAATIEAQAGKLPDGPGPPISAAVVPGSASESSASPGAPVNPGQTTTALSGGSGVPGQATVPPGASGPTIKAPGVIQQSVAGVRRTPALPAPAVGALLLTILISGALAATFSPILQSPVIHRLSAAVRRLLRREVTPTKQ